MKLQEKYEKIIQKYINKFCKKHDTYLEFWVGDQIGHIAVMGDTYMAFRDIVHDINTNQPKDYIWDYYDYMFENPDNHSPYDLWCEQQQREKLRGIVPDFILKDKEFLCDLKLIFSN